MVLLLPVMTLTTTGRENPVLPDPEVLALYEKVTQLMEASTALAPGLARASAPLIETARQSIVTLRGGPNAQDTTLHYTFLTNMRAFLALSDAIEKPFPYPEAARQQSIELRESAERVEAHFRGLLALKEALLRDPDPNRISRYEEDNQRLGPPDRENPRVVFLGDSITEGWRLNEYFPERDYINRGISGQVSSQMLARFQSDVVDVKPVAVHLLAGTNDIGRGTPLHIIQDNFRMMADLADHHKIKVLIGSVLPVHDYNKEKNPAWERTARRPMATIRELNTWLETFCSSRGYIYLNYFGHMLDANGQLRAEFAEDGLHPSREGYRVMAQEALKALEKVARPVPVEKRRRRILF